MSWDWRGRSAEELEKHFNPRVAIGDPEAVARGLARYAELSAQARQTLAGEYDIRYGAGEKQTLDAHRPAKAGAPILLFIHGGFWRALDKSDHSFIAPAFVEAGACFVNLNYDLCPKVTLDDIVREAREGLAWVWRNAVRLGGDPNRLFIAGHSAGAHLCALLLAHDWTAEGLPADAIKGAACLSGIYETAPVLRISVNADVRLDQATAERCDALSRPPRRKAPLLITVGADEPEGWRAQTEAYAAACRAAGAAPEVQVVPAANHFTLIHDFAAPAGVQHRAMRRMMEL
jgi:arylformamidase